MPGRLVSEQERQRSEEYFYYCDNYSLSDSLDKKVNKLRKENNKITELKLKLQGEDLLKNYLKTLNDHLICCESRISDEEWEFFIYHNSITLRREIIRRYRILSAALKIPPHPYIEINCPYILCRCPGDPDLIQKINHSLLRFTCVHTQDIQAISSMSRKLRGQE